MWDVGTGDLLGTHLGHVGGVQGVAFVPSGSAIATAGGDHTVRLWRPTGRELADLPASGGAGPRRRLQPGRSAGRRGR